jgi:hypothetical protein
MLVYGLDERTWRMCSVECEPNLFVTFRLFLGLSGLVAQSAKKWEEKGNEGEQKRKKKKKEKKTN